MEADVDQQPLPEGEISAHALRRPFWLAGHGARARVGVLAVHGFSGTPFEMRPLGEALARAGYTVYGPRLAGHCADAAALGRTRYPDWVASVNEAFDQLSQRVERVYVAGLSLGGLLTLDLAQRRGEAGGPLVGISVLAAPIWLTRGPQMAIRITRKLGRTPRFTLPKLGGSDVADPRMRQRNNLAQGAGGLPIEAVLSLADFMDRVRAGLPEVKVPALLAHGKLDHTAPYDCMAAIAREIGSSDVETLDAPRSFHVLPIDLDRDEICAAVERHIAKLTE